MIIKEVEICNIYDCKHLILQFDNKRRSSVYVVQNNDDPKCNNLLTLAVQLLCSAKYAYCNFRRNSYVFNNIHEGFVRIKFILPITSDRYAPDAIGTSIDDEKHVSSSPKFILIDACRDFRSLPDEVSYSINQGPKAKSSLPAFHGRFYICLDYMLPSLKNLTLNFTGNWLKLLSSDLNERWNRRAQLDDPFEKFLFLYRKYGYPEQHILSEVTRAHLTNTDAMEALQKSYVIKILRDTRGIFEFITAGEYTVFFYVPHYGRYADVVFDLSVEDLNFEYMTTHIQDNSKSSNQKLIWTEAQPAIKDMLLISFQISMSFHCKQQIIYLSNFEEISNYQAMQFATTACFQKLGLAKPAWTSKNYLQRIVDVCITSGTTAIIEYPGGTPLHPVNAYLMKSYKFVEANRTWLSLKIINDERYSFEYFLQCLTEGLKNV